MLITKNHYNPTTCKLQKMEYFTRTVWLITLLCTCQCDRFKNFEDRLRFLERRISAEIEFRSHDTSAVFRRLDEMDLLINTTLEETFEKLKSDGVCGSSRTADDESFEQKFRNLESDIELLRLAFQSQKLYTRDIRETYSELESKFEQLKRKTEEGGQALVIAHKKDRDETKGKFDEIGQENKHLVEALKVLEIKIQKPERVHVHSEFTSCKNAFDKGFTSSGRYYLRINDEYNKVLVYCDQETDSGGWTVFQRRKDGSEDFYRGWNDYRDGFGYIEGEFWLGNKYIHALTGSRSRELRIDLGDFEGNKAFAKYRTFRIANEIENYTLAIGGYEGNAGDSLTVHNGQGFTTKDRDNDYIANKTNCAVLYTGAWWYHKCLASNLNGYYYQGDNSPRGKGVVWHYWKNSSTYSLKFVEMKLR